MKIKLIIGILMFIVATWATNSVYLNKVSQSEKLLAVKEREVETLSRKYDSLIIEYDNTIDLGKIKKTLEKQGMQVSREVNYFKISENNQ
ncbi:MAG: hypothetical protein ACRC54_06270 [Fusobacteriaceae bacterium]